VKLPGGNLGNASGGWLVRGQKFDWALFVNALVAFTITAAVLYFFVVLPMNRLAKRRKEGEEPDPEAPSEEVRLLTEIRDALKAQAKAQADAPQPPDPRQATAAELARTAAELARESNRTPPPEPPDAVSER
jgi:hypothetical protein